MNSPSVSISWKRAIEIVLLNATMEFFNNYNFEKSWDLDFVDRFFKCRNYCKISFGKV